MAKTFKRFAKGGRFKREDFGDLGLGAFKNQQDQIINSFVLTDQEVKKPKNIYQVIN